MTSLQPLGVQAVLACFSGEEDALRFAAAVRRANPAWLLDVVQAYATVAVFFALDAINFAAASLFLRELSQNAGKGEQAAETKVHRIPCCYEMNLDLRRVAEHSRLSD